MPETNGTIAVKGTQDIVSMLKEYRGKDPANTVQTVYKYCRTCEGRRFAEVTLTFDGQQVTQILPCAHCQGRGTHMWGFLLDGVDPLCLATNGGGDDE